MLLKKILIIISSLIFFSSSVYAETAQKSIESWLNIFANQSDDKVKIYGKHMLIQGELDLSTIDQLNKKFIGKLTVEQERRQQMDEDLLPIVDLEKISHARALSLLGINEVSLNSPGGVLEVALYLGDLVKNARMETIIKSGSLCASGCSYIFSQGVKRVAGNRFTSSIS